MPGILQAGMWVLLSAGLGLLPVRQSGPTEAVLLARCPPLAAVVQGEGWRGALINPVLRSEAEVEATAERYRGALDCLRSEGTAAGEWVPFVTFHLELFLDFADPIRAGSDTSRADQVDFRRVADPAVTKLREELGLAPPEGLVFVRYFESRERMPARIRGAFAEPDTRAVTIGARYIAVLLPEAPGAGAGAVVEDSLEATLSHELVHAFLNARLDWDREEERFPSWFHEGMAIYFSGSGRRHVTLDPVSGQVFRIAPTAEYARYERVFAFLESELGEERFRSVLKTAVENVDASLVLEAADATTYEDLEQAAERWWRWWPVPVGWTSGPALGLLTVFALVAAAAAWRLWRRWEPAMSGSVLEVQLNRDLLDAVRSADAAHVRELLASGADANAVGDGWPVLEWAVWLDAVDVAETLLEAGAEVTPEVRRTADMRSETGTMVRLLADAALRHGDASDSG